MYAPQFIKIFNHLYSTFRFEKYKSKTLNVMLIWSEIFREISIIQFIKDSLIPLIISVMPFVHCVEFDN